MILELKETEKITQTPERNQWYNDPVVQDYLVFREQADPEDDEQALTHFRRYYEIYNDGRHVGDIKIFYANEEDIFKKRAQKFIAAKDQRNLPECLLPGIAFQYCQSENSETERFSNRPDGWR